MSEILLGGLLAEWAITELPHANFTGVLAPSLEVFEDQFGMPTLEVGAGEASLTRASRLTADDLETFNRIASAYNLTSAEVEIDMKGETKAIKALFSNALPRPRDVEAPQILQAVVKAKSDRLARAVVIGASYRFSAFELAQKDTRGMKYTHQGAREDFANINVETLNVGFYELVRLGYRHMKFDGEMSSELHREVMITGDAVIVLPYDPILDQVVLIEQIRPAALTRRSFDAWELEAVAGMIDQGESPESTAYRELEEEAGLKAQALYAVPPFYQSPGSLSQFMYPFIALVDLSTYQSGVFGLETEGEDIRTHILSRAEAVHLLKTGEANNAPLQILLYELALNCQEISAQLLANKEKAK